MGENCSTGCLTRDHTTYGECMRSKSLRVAYCQSWKGHDYTRSKKWENDLGAYKSAKEQGVQPATTVRKDVDKAMKVSNETGTAFKA